MAQNKKNQVNPNTKHRRLRTPDSPTMQDQSFLKQQEEEVQEVNNQLSSIRKKYDTAKQMTTKRQSELNRIKYELNNISKLEKRSENTVQEMQSKLDKLTSLLQETKLKFEEACLQKDSYKYVLSRLKQEKIAQEYKANQLMDQLDFKQQELFNEHEKTKKFKEKKLATKAALSDTKKNMQLDIQLKEQKLRSLERNIQQRKAHAIEREIQLKKQSEIMEVVGGKEDKESVETKMRDQLLVHKFWHFILKRVLEKEEKKSKNIEQAYQQVKSTTGITDMNEIVEKFLDRDQTYKQLLTDVDVAEKKLDKLREGNESMKKTLKNLEFTEQKEVRTYTQDQVEDLQTELHELQRQHQDLKERQAKAKGIYEQVANWGQKTLQRIKKNVGQEQSQPEKYIDPRTDQLLKIFTEISDLVDNGVKDLLEDKTNVQEIIESRLKKGSEQLQKQLKESKFMRKNVRVPAVVSLEEDEKELNQDENEFSELKELRVKMKEEALKDIKIKEEMKKLRKANMEGQRRSIMQIQIKPSANNNRSSVIQMTTGSKSAR